jgi:hypothetical protein
MNCAKRSPGQRRVPRPWVLFALASLALTPLSACVKKPELKLHHAEIRAASMYGLGMEVFLVVNNSNSYDVQVRNIRATVTLANQYSVPLQFSPNSVLPSGRSVIIAVPMTVPWAMLPGLITASSGSATVPFRVRGNADVTAMGFIDRDEYPVDEEGTIPRQAFVDAARSVMPLRF